MPIRSDLQEAFRREWAFLAAPGTWWSGPERVAIAEEARGAMSGERSASPPQGAAELSEAVADVVRRVAVESPLITAEWVTALPGRGIGLPAYAEIVGVVSRLSSVDQFHRALGLPLEALPEPLPGEPSRTQAPTEDLVEGKSYLPMVGRISIPQTISIVPEESTAWYELSDVMYMTFEEMDDPDFRRALHRTQMELVAARTSQLNECFY